ncbi:uncharacterized protein LOC113276583 [Papaver somniferum]|uniref:uncharacterized protein LOC113276583 n=1 Tax=Papaver somniferum TaxID=3469 RepID=UPI000E6FE0E3|nr:uncharacterized protein LOC113276583 [Papaver somniferum]
MACYIDNFDDGNDDNDGNSLYLQGGTPGIVHVTSAGQPRVGQELARQQHLQRLTNLDSPIAHLSLTTEAPKSAHSSLHQFVQSAQFEVISVVSDSVSPSWHSPPEGVGVGVGGGGDGGGGGGDGGFAQQHWQNTEGASLYRLRGVQALLTCLVPIPEHTPAQ